MSKGKRTEIDFSKHIHTTEHHPKMRVDVLEIPGSVVNRIVYINTHGCLMVKGDFGNWMFCREFHPSEDGYVSDSYWTEKLETLSTQTAKKYSPEKTEKELREAISEVEEITDDLKEQVAYKEYYENCLDYVYDEHDYISFAFRDGRPSFMDYEDVIFAEEYRGWLQIVFDGFDEMCNRIANSINKKETGHRYEL